VSTHSPGPWRWILNPRTGELALLARGRFVVMDFVRYRMQKATIRLRDATHDLMYRVQERSDWHAPEHGREHHSGWHAILLHPDAKLIEAAPDLHDACILARSQLSCDCGLPCCNTCDTIRQLDAAIKKAIGAE
jgi:hypothetical protein